MTVKTKTALTTQANTDLPNNATGQISPTDVRTLFVDVIDTMALMPKTIEITLGGNKTLVAADVVIGGHLIVVIPNTATASSDIDLPALSTVFTTVSTGGGEVVGRPSLVTIKNLASASFPVNALPNGAEDIDGNASVNIPTGASVSFLTTSTQWVIV